MKSIRKFLLSSLLLLIIAQAGISVYKLFNDSRKSLGRFYDDQLIQVAGAIPHNIQFHDEIVNDCDDGDRKKIVVAIWVGASQKPLYRSCSFVELMRPTSEGFKNEVILGEPWRLYARLQDDRVIVVAQPWRIRSKVLMRLTSSLIVQVLILIPFFLLVLWFAVNRGLKPLRQFTQELQSRSSTALDNVSLNNLPRELLPVAHALNDLLNRLKQILASQKNFVADAAHEILTPLTALQVQLQVMERAKTEERRVQATRDVRKSLERCINLARQLLALARSSTEMHESSFRAVELVAVAERAVEEALSKAQERQIDLGILADQPVPIMGDEFSLQLLFRNLIDNAVKYSPIGGRVDVAIRMSDHPQIVVSDAGPGITLEEHARVFDRFYRRLNPDVEGSGLGLAIVKEIADRHRAQIKLNTPGILGGLDIIVQFPRIGPVGIVEPR